MPNIILINAAQTQPKATGLFLKKNFRNPKTDVGMGTAFYMRLKTKLSQILYQSVCILL